MKLPKYTEYKDSGVEWLGNVPSHWAGPNKLGAISSLKGRLGWQGLKAEEYQTDGPYVVSSAHFSEHKIRWDECPRVSQQRYETDSNIQLATSDILLMKDGAAMGKLAFVDKLPGDACLNSHLLLFRPLIVGGEPTYFPRFVFYFMQTTLFQEHIKVNGTGATFLGISQDAIARYLVVWPSIAEQKCIAAFLDSETGKIDALISEQEQLLTLLAEKRQAAIAHAVMRGLNPDVQLKDSGAAWLGEVPAHWNLVRLAHLFKEVNEAGDESLPILSVSIHDGVSDKELNDVELDRKVARSDDRSKYKRVASGDLVYNMMRAWQGGFGTVSTPGMVSPAYVVARPVENGFLTCFVEQLLRTPQGVQEMKRYSRGITDFRLRLYWDEFKNIRIGLPPRHEQELIMAHLDEVAEFIDGLAEKATHAIDLLRERRGALITAAVTGKIDVRKEAAVLEAAA